VHWPALSTLAEEGCLSYRLFTSAVDPATFVTIEKWRSQSDLDQHMQTPHIQQALAVAGEHFRAAPSIHPLQPSSTA
jgi:quinol monooxygenase YgiN